MTHKGAFSKHYIRTCIIQGIIYKEIFLLTSECGNNLVYIFIKILANLYCCPVKFRKSFEKRCFIIESFTGIRYEYGRDTKCSTNDEYRRRDIPCSVAPCFE